jgi:hypothetical protein
MRKALLIAGLMTAFMLLVVAASAQKASFAGDWNLDKAKSQGLSQRMQGADSVIWTIAQDDKTISINQKITGGTPPAGGGGGGTGGGGGMGGGRGMGGPVAYNLDGSETTSENGPAKSTLKATWAGSTLELSRKTTFAGPNGEVTSSESRKLSLSGDGKTLTAVVHSESPRGTTDSTLVLTKP